MRKGSDLIGKPIIAFDTGEQVDQVRDLLFDQQSNQLLGFLVDEGGWFSDARALPLERVQSIGPDAVIVPDKEVVVSASQMPAIRAVLERNNVLKGTKIMTTDGRDLGTISDLYFDDHTGRVEGYEVSGGLFADAYTGRAFVPATHTLKIGQDVAFVPPATAARMEEHTAGFQSTLQTTEDRRQNTPQSGSTSPTNVLVDPAQQRAYVLGRVAEHDVEAPDGTLIVTRGQRVTPLAAAEAERQGILDALYRATGSTLTARINDDASAARLGSPVDVALGRRVQHAVRTDEGLLIAAPSQIVTEQVVNRARTYHKENELLEAVGLSATEVARTQAGERLTASTPTAASQLHDGLHQATANTGNLWERLKEKVNELQERTAQEAQEARIKSALGRPVSRVILDPQDNVILNVGELITHQALEQATRAGVLDILLSSVYDTNPEGFKGDVRAPEPGEASLEQRERHAGG